MYVYVVRSQVCANLVLCRYILFEVPLALKMICANCRIEGAVQIGSGCVLQPLCTVLSTTAAGITIGEKNNIEEMCSIVDSNIGHGNLIQVGTAIEKSEVFESRIVFLSLFLMPLITVTDWKLHNYWGKVYDQRRKYHR